MTRVLLVGLQPEAVDYSDAALPPGMDAKKIQAGIEQGLKTITDRGWQADTCLIQPDATAGPAVEQRLGATTYDCVVIGAGVRLPPKGRFPCSATESCRRHLALAGHAYRSLRGRVLFRVVDAKGEKTSIGDEQAERSTLLVAAPFRRASDGPSLFDELSLAQYFDDFV